MWLAPASMFEMGYKLHNSDNNGIDDISSVLIVSILGVLPLVITFDFIDTTRNYWSFDLDRFTCEGRVKAEAIS